MPPKKKPAPKEEPKQKDDELPRTRIRAQPVARSDSEDLKASKKMKKD